MKTKIVILLRLLGNLPALSSIAQNKKKFLLFRNTAGQTLIRSYRRYWREWKAMYLQAVLDILIQFEPDSR